MCRCREKRTASPFCFSSLAIFFFRCAVVMLCIACVLFFFRFFLRVTYAKEALFLPLETIPRELEENRQTKSSSSSSWIVLNCELCCSPRWEKNLWPAQSFLFSSSMTIDLKSAQGPADPFLLLPSSRVSSWKVDDVPWCESRSCYALDAFFLFVPSHVLCTFFFPAIFFIFLWQKDARY